MGCGCGYELLYFVMDENCSLSEIFIETGECPAAAGFGVKKFPKIAQKLLARKMLSDIYAQVHHV